jgi:DNA-binding CsgD family transcriptional regulator
VSTLPTLCSTLVAICAIPARRASSTSRDCASRNCRVCSLTFRSSFSYKEIGMRLGLAEITVKTHLTAIFRLLRVVNRTQAVVAIRRLGVDYASKGEESQTSAP